MKKLIAAAFGAASIALISTWVTSGATETKEVTKTYASGYSIPKRTQDAEFSI